MSKDLSLIFPLTVDESYDGKRVDVLLATIFPQVSRSRWTQLIDQGLIHIKARKLESSSKVRCGQIIECDMNAAFFSETEFLFSKTFDGTKPEVIFEDKDLLVVHKPAGLAVHAGSGLKESETLVAWLSATGRIKESAIEAYLRWDAHLIEAKRPGIVHRLDKGTSGGMVIAKNPSTHEALALQFSSRTAGRWYWAVVEGRLERLQKNRPRRLDDILMRKPPVAAFRMLSGGIYSLATFFERDPVHRTRFRVSSEGLGKKAISHFAEASSSKKSPYSLVEFKLQTGRTHQIRVHASYLGFPILGDESYGGKAHSRVMLHAHHLMFVHPSSHERLNFEIPWPQGDDTWLQLQELTCGSPLLAGARDDKGGSEGRGGEDGDEGSGREDDTAS